MNRCRLWKTDWRSTIFQIFLKLQTLISFRCFWASSNYILYFFNVQIDTFAQKFLLLLQTCSRHFFTHTNLYFWRTHFRDDSPASWARVFPEGKNQIFLQVLRILGPAPNERLKNRFGNPFHRCGLLSRFWDGKKWLLASWPACCSRKTPGRPQNTSWLADWLVEPGPFRACICHHHQCAIVTVGEGPTSSKGCSWFGIPGTLHECVRERNDVRERDGTTMRLRGFPSRKISSCEKLFTKHTHTRVYEW